MLALLLIPFVKEGKNSRAIEIRKRITIAIAQGAKSNGLKTLTVNKNGQTVSA